MSKKATKKAVAKKAAKKSPEAKKATSKAAQASAPSKKAPAAKKAATKSPAKKTAAKKAASKSSDTLVVAKVNVGWGNTLFVRGEGAGLSWDKGSAMKIKGDDEWSLKLKGAAEVKFLINDENWAEGDNVSVPAGKTTLVTPIF